MPKRPVDLSGKKFGRLVAISYGKYLRNRYAWRCRCDCGNEIVAASSSLTLGGTASCGCLRSETTKARNTKHGQAKSPMWNVWVGMKSRINNPTGHDLRSYGHLEMSDRWDSFENFLADMGHRPSPLHSIERIDNSKGYFPGNCRWATPRDQANNRRNNRIITYQGEKMTFAEAVRRAPFSVSYGTAHARVFDYGWSIDKALGSAPARSACKR